MNERPRLVVAIPTYNRSSILGDNLQKMLKEISALEIPIFISDDSTNDDTRQLAAAISLEYRHIFYRHNVPALGHDANIVSTLCWPDADYVWLLGDALWINPGCFRLVLDSLLDQDFLFVRAHSEKASTVLNQQGEQAYGLIREVLWHQTMTGATVYSDRACRWARSQGENFKCMTNFPQLSVVLGYSSSTDITVGWLGSPCIQTVQKTSYWRTNMLKVFVEDWGALVHAFPVVIPPGYRQQVIRSHSERANLFNVHILLDLKVRNQLVWSTLKRPHFFDAMHLSRWRIIPLILLDAGTIDFCMRLNNRASRLWRGFLLKFRKSARNRAE